jgi:esterase/lipase
MVTGMSLGVIDLLVAAVPVVASIVGLWFKMHNLVSKQEIKIETLDQEIKEMKRHNEKQEERIASKLDTIDSKITELMLHFSSCINFKSNK